MSDGERFAIIREAEAEALQRLAPLALKAFVAIKFGRRDGEEFAFGVRDLEEWGIKRSAAAASIAELVSAGLLAIVAESSFGAKRRRRVFKVAHTRKSAPLQSAPADTAEAYSPPARTMTPATVRPG